MDLIFLLLMLGGIAYGINRFKAAKSAQQQLNFGKTGKSDAFGGAMAGAVGGAATMLLLNHLYNQHNLDAETMEKMQQMDHEQLQQFALEQGLMQQQELDLLAAQMDPYQNPGSDIVVDEYYHGIDHGLDNYYNHDSGGFDDFGGFGGFGDHNF